jgi:hypothetical protein
VQFDEDNLVAGAGLVLVAILAQHLELAELFSTRDRLGDAPGRANVAAKAITLIHSALAIGDCIDDADALRGAASGRRPRPRKRRLTNLGATRILRF